jgi:chloramphenicol 3-O-phosphotransferase
VVCAGNDRDFKFLIGLLARWAQHPEKVGEVALVLRGVEGAGKGTVADILKEWFKHHYVHIQQSRHLLGNFNAHLIDALLVFADEVVWGGDKAGDGEVLKLLENGLGVHRR